MCETSRRGEAVVAVGEEERENEMRRSAALSSFTPPVPLCERADLSKDEPTTPPNPPEPQSCVASPALSLTFVEVHGNTD